MSRRSKRLGAPELEDDRISTSSVESHVLYRDRESPGRTLRKKVTTIKRVPSIPQESREYYSETSTYVSRDRLGGSYGLRDDDYGGPYLGQSHLDEGALPVSWWKRWARRVGRLPWLVISFPGHAFGVLYWWFGTTWYRVTTSASLLDVFILTRHYNVLKKILLVLSALLLLALVGAGLWHFYPFGFPALLSAPIAAFSREHKPVSDDPLRKENLDPRIPPLSSQSDWVSRMESLERRLHGLENGLSQLNLQDKARKVDKEVPVMAGLSRDEVEQVFSDLSRNREADLKEGLLQEGITRSKAEVKTLREEQQEKLQEILQKMHQMSEIVEGQIQQLRTEIRSPPRDTLRENLLQEVGELGKQLMGLQGELNSVRKTQVEMSHKVDAVPGKIDGVKDEVHSLFPVWLLGQTEQSSDGAGSLSDLFMRRDELQKHLLELERKILSGISAERKQWASQAHSTIDRELQAGGLPGVSRSEVHEIVNRALQRYSEDRIGLVDYALESSGASVINTRCSETFETKTALLSLFGIPLWYQSQSPRVILQPDTNPGNCWAFRGSQGYAVIRLSSRIQPTAVTLDHIPRSLSPKDTISSAPRNFSVYGLEEESQKDGTLLGHFTYNQHGEPIQTFPIQGEDKGFYQLVELRIESNWGHPEYTCIYRFRVHGETEM
ncbi:SUN domain-containing protein 2 isoform X2 [Bombina bombina]|uniref:SUN domain-containing protein 2 isoform X2 n=1 Tax=Bombina bombina TaxID=8345 RepID=UPI00235B1759|nr:SUN domain-containing protein 2 isoform X2 [Bombina bombina]